MTTPSSAVAAALARWRSNLIDLTRRNPLLALRPTRSSTLTLSHPSASLIWQRLVTEDKSCTFWMPPVDEDEQDSRPEPVAFDLDDIHTKPGEIVCGDLGRRELLRTLTNIYRKSTAEYRERGLHILYVAFGVLQWRDQDNADSLRSPLVLVPVELARSSLREPFRLHAIDEEPLVNPALAARLQQDFDFRLPDAPDAWEDAEIGAYLQQVETAITGLPGWIVEPVTQLSLFSFFKGVMYRDLEENADKAAAHPLVRALAGESVSDALTPTGLAIEDELDDVQPPAKTFTILDADASQRLCLEAAARGHSFVLYGPPGTGKSQTIANLIAECLANGKKVLFVSEKMAALEVVFNRLRAHGLGDFCLELHSHKANKRAVVHELKRTLEERRQGEARRPDENFDKLQQRRDQLTKYVQALHQPREPLHRSVWWAFGELVRCASMPAVTCNLGDGVDMTGAWLDESRQALQRVQQLWHIPEQGPDYPWCGFKVVDRFTLKLRDEVISALDKAKKQLERLVQVTDHYAAQIGARGTVPWLLRAGDLLAASPRPFAAWLTAPDLPQIGEELEKCAEQFKQRGQSRQPLTDHYGAFLWSLPEKTAAAVEDAWHQAAPLLAPGDEKGAGLLTHQQQLRGWAAETQKRIPGWLTDARTIEKWLAIDLPQGADAGASEDPSPFWLKRLLRLAHLCASENAPERSWVVDPKALAQARAMIDANRPALAKYHQTRNKLLLKYTEQFFDLDLERIADGFSGPYLSWFRFFNMDFRRDRRAIARRSKEHQMPASIHEDIVVASDLTKEKARLDGEQSARLAVLGRYEKGLNSDCDAAERAGRIAAEAVELVHELGHEQLPEKFVEALSSAGSPPEKIKAAMKRLQESVGNWSHATEELKEYLPLESLPGTDQPLEESAVSILLEYAKRLQAALNHFGSRTDSVLSKARSQPPDAVSLVADLREAELLQQQEANLDADNARWVARFGPPFQGLATDWDQLRRSLAWTLRVREHFGGESLPAAFVQLAASPNSLDGPTKELRHAQELLESALHSFEIRFEQPGPLVAGKRLGALPLEDLKKRLTELRERAGELADWIDWHNLGKRFEHLGLAEFWLELQKQHLQREQLVDVFLKSMMTRWLDGVLLKEPALAEFRRQEHENALEEFRALDRELLRGNAERVALAASKSKSSVLETVAEKQVALLMREAHKKSRHLPVRRLFDEIPELLLQLKPCMLMSPLSVSQFLDPSVVQFDLVVFDEASQICPEDAIGAILRGKQVVVTGDDKQLPPTSFFERMVDDGDDDDNDDSTASFESVLDACLGAGLRPHLLRWHYRSRREGLIAYSNHQFYDNRLITFPGPLTGPDAVGVEMLHVPDGVYDRGGRRDNRREAQVVADLVIDHLRQHGDRRTLGVIAFSQAHMFAIEDEIDSRLADEPDLEQLIQQDRLGGFFVKNLETVQGDERDVIVLSVGYGRDADGKFAMHFGPLNREGGQRRLNVAVTRAREKLVVVSSIRAADLDLSATKAQGVHHLRRYLDFAERGLEALALAESNTPAASLSPLEADVAKEVEQLGYRVVPQVGCSGYRIDLGVVDPREPGQYLLGIECDGLHYHATPTTRDRDRLRQEILQKLGWQLHRIWSTEWFQRKHQEVERLRQALEAAKALARPQGTMAVKAAATEKLVAEDASQRQAPSPERAKVPL
jgi:very-short-patch-repair endonuclease/DNA polymerase III delta prime subunit